MNKFGHFILMFALLGVSTSVNAQFNESGISAGFFDASKEDRFTAPGIATGVPNVTALVSGSRVAFA